MSNTMNPVLIRTANKKQNQKNFNFRHSGTSDFFKPQVIHCQRVTAGEKCKINCNIQMYSRPLAMPANIAVNHNVRAFWVPAWATHKDWFRFRTNLPFTLAGSFGKHNEDTYMYNVDLVRLFIEYNDGGNKLIQNQTIIVGQPGTDPVADIVCAVIDTDDTTVLGYYTANFTNQGRILYNLLIQLGYEIKWVVKWISSLTWATTLLNVQVANGIDRFASDRTISAKALLSFIKVMMDWYTPTQYEEYFEQQWEAMLDKQRFGNNWATDQVLVSLMTWVNYEQDRFTGAWKNPQGPNQNNTEIIIQDPTLNGANLKNAAQEIVTGVDTGTPVINRRSTYPSGAPSSLFMISDYMLRALNAIQNFTTRNRIAGYRPIDRMLAHFGVHVDYKLIKRSTYITGTSQSFSNNTTPVMSNNGMASTIPSWENDSNYAGGAGSAMGNDANINFTWNCEDDGYIIIIDTILPRVGYYQGIKHHNHMVDWRELYIPEFDNLGTEAIPRSEIFNAFRGKITSGTNIHNNDVMIWGFEPTNAGIKTGYDTLSGDYRRKTINVGIDAMHTMRVFDDDGDNVPTSVSADFLKGDNKEYERVFQYMGDEADHFKFTAVTVDEGSGPWESISESLPITDGEGQMAKFNYGGSSYMN